MWWLVAGWLAAGAAEPMAMDTHKEAMSAPASTMSEAIFASGCFWCAEKDFEKLPGVGDVVSGFAGGHVEHPSYSAVGTGSTGHTEAIRVPFDASKISYEQLLDHYWRHVDFLDGGGQFCDRGPQYRPAIFPRDATQRAAAEKSKAAIEAQFGQPVAVKLETADRFWPAEDYHQNYYKTHPIRYTYYRNRCGRDARVSELWKGQPHG